MFPDVVFSQESKAKIEKQEKHVSKNILPVSYCQTFYLTRIMDRYLYIHIDI